MNRTVVKSRIGADGVLRVTLPLGAQEADQEVQVTVEPLTAKAVPDAAWAVWVESMAGSWQGDFERPPQGQAEERDPL